jgi:hypothetical protein
MNRLTRNDLERLLKEAHLPTHPWSSRTDYIRDMGSYLSRSDYPKKQPKTYDNLYAFIVEKALPLQPYFSEHDTAV